MADFEDQMQANFADNHAVLLRGVQASPMQGITEFTDIFQTR